MALRVRWCPRNHDKLAVGVDKGGHCKPCRRTRIREAARRRRAANAKEGCPPQWYGEPREAVTGLRRTRESLGLSKQQLAALTGLDRKTLYNLEAGRCSPYPATKCALLDTLGPLLKQQQRLATRKVNAGL